MKRASIILVLVCIVNAALAQGPRGSGVPGVRGNNQVEPSAPLQLYPKFTLGQTLHYQLDFRSRMNGTTVGLIEDPQALKEIAVSLSALMRLDVVQVVANVKAQAGRPAVRLRTTYSKVAVTTKADVPDPQVDNLRARLQKLEQQAMEFTIEPDGNVTNVSGLENIFPEQIQAVHAWISQLGYAASFPEKGIRIGEKWTFDLPMNGNVPLAGMVWRKAATYLRNEACHAERAPVQDKLGKTTPGEQCAVILTTLTLADNSKKGDRTPDEFRKKNLRTAGAINGQGEGLTYVSLETGQVVSVTQTSGQEMNVTVTSLSTGSSLRYSGRVETQSQLSMVDVAPSPRK